MFVYAGSHERTMRELFVPGVRDGDRGGVVLDAGLVGRDRQAQGVAGRRPGYDLLITDATQGYPAIKDGLFARLDLANIPNHKLLAPSALDNWVFRDRVRRAYPDT